MEDISRPANVIVPVHVQQRIDATRLLNEDASVADMRAFLRERGVKVPQGADKDDIRSLVMDNAGTGVITERATTAASTTGADDTTNTDHEGSE